MICLFFRFGQILKFLHLLIARSPKNPMETLATPDGRRQFQGDTHASFVMDFLQHLETERNNSPRTRNARLVAIKSFMRFLEHRVPSLLEHSRRILALPAKRTDIRLISYLTLEEMQAVLNAPHLQRRDGIRDRAMLHLCFAAGLRVSELVGLPLHALELQPSPHVRLTFRTLF